MTKKNFENGRSMVEMLGVLAVMGVLSVAGIAGYNNAMNRHRANELIYEAQKRATTVAMQITAGRDTLSVAEFPNPTGYVFGVEKNPNNANQFNITLDTVPTDICTQMKTVVGSATAIRVISNDCTTLTFNNDLSKTLYTSDFNSNEDACKKAGFHWCAYGEQGIVAKCSDNSDCCTNIIYDSQCQFCTSTTGAISDQSGSCIYTYPDGTIGNSTCNKGVCLKPGTNIGDSCTTTYTNADCGGDNSGYYCRVTGSDSSTPDNGTCQSRGGRNNLIEIILPSGDKVYAFPNSNQIMSWWAADQYCAAHGMRRAPKTLFEGANAPSNKYTLYNTFAKFGISGSWYWLNDSSDFAKAWILHIAHNTEAFFSIAKNSTVRVLCVRP